MKLRALLGAGLMVLATSAWADFARVGPVNPANGFPKWYQDLNGLVLDLCLATGPDSGAAQQTACLLTTPPPYTFPGSFPDEVFYFRATSLLNTSASQRASLVLALEAAFANGGPVAGDQMVFARIRVTAGVPFPGTYRVIHPWGEETFVDVQASGTNRDIVFTEDVGITAGEFSQALKGRAGPFLTRADGTFVTINGAQFLSDGAALETLTGSRFGTNTFSMCGPFDGPGSPDRCIEEPGFTLTGRVHDSVADPIASPLTIQRATYARENNATRVDASASASAGIGQAAPKLSVGAAKLPPVLMNGPNNLGLFYAQGLAVPPEAVPGLLSVINSADVPPSMVTQMLVDEVTVLSATYDPTPPGTLTVIATSSDKGLSTDPAGTLPLLRLDGYPPGPSSAITAPGTGEPGNGDVAAVKFVVTGLTVPPPHVDVVSSAGGIGRLDPTMALAPPFAPGVPLARDDTATTTAGGAAQAVVIPVKANDIQHPDAQILPGAVNILAPGITPAGFGTLTALPDGTVQFTPTATTGQGTFKYTVANGVGPSNPATVTITVNPGAGGPTPIAVNDPDAGALNILQGQTLTVNVLANDSGNGGTLDNTSVVITVPPPAGLTGVNASTGTITYTAPANGVLGPVSLQYTVKNTNGNTSNPATVNFNVVAPETVTITRARCTNNRWDVRGTASTGSTSVTLYNTAFVPASPTAAQTLGTAPVAAGAFQFQASGPACVATISLQTSLGTKANNIQVGR